MTQNFGGFTAKGNWYKGNLHCHTNRSDGRNTPEEMVEFYKKEGHDFLAITDHTKKLGQGNVPENPAGRLTTKSFLVLPGAEYDWSLSKTIVHMVVVGPGYDIQPTPGESVDFSGVTQTAWNAGGFIWWAHPYWSNNSTEDLERMEFLPAFEVFNNCDKGLGEVYWDRVLGLGANKKILGLATDDTHSTHPLDHRSGAVIVKSENLTAPAIIAALRRGDFYASCGPVINDIYFENKEETSLRIRCSPARTIKLLSAGGRYDIRHAPAGKPFTDVVLPWKWQSWPGAKPYLRIEIIDSEGRSAWSQAVYPPAKIKIK